jgi:hypothetical protein
MTEVNLNALDAEIARLEKKIKFGSIGQDIADDVSRHRSRYAIGAGCDGQAPREPRLKTRCRPSFRNQCKVLAKARIFPMTRFPP